MVRLYNDLANGESLCFQDMEISMLIAGLVLATCQLDTVNVHPPLTSCLVIKDIHLAPLTLILR